ncbi:putative SOS response-associated peptidase YedK [Paenibacillus sp. V4I3]|uniref:SOS response-associated peptidase n=1 Tax=unclassified Paenibacillus TaxID=185978 RepID=UPI00277E1C91|nr:MULTISPECIES: SOS response-associated peptidase [unclassified Paenibacillus]MDQ0872878.1 putative SOS response-associated peptidase YedK [Paenibacillus sp. V4I3]MDQ0891204.1 putative SOS response-associated peptidase YedK [Paenibacillus sp. V4I9]
MCHSISILADVNELVKQFRIDRLLSYSSNRYEVRPTESVSAVMMNKKGERILDEFRWGLMPFWAKDAVCGDRDSIFTNVVFERIVRKQRCIIPCSGFYISVTEGKETEWIKFKMRSGTFGIAGLYDVWRAPSGEEELRTCMMLMTEANSLVSPYQRRMPAILDQDQGEMWLQPEMKDSRLLRSILRPVDDLLMVANVLSSPAEKLESGSDVSVFV